ncbi:MAG: shikimate dehydrogenase [Candidatus Micrarchaeaceae archaeon]
METRRICKTGMHIDNNTKLLCIIGMPARHSLSPIIHNAAFKRLGLNMVFMAFDVPPSRLKAAIESVRTFNMPGITLTSPHKIEVMKYIDYISDQAKSIGAVNTLVNKNGKLYGYNTDAPGFAEALKTKTRINGKRITLIGAGGAARACAFELENKYSVDLTILNRTISHARSIKEDIYNLFGKEITVDMLDNAKVKDYLKETDILINATNITLENSSKSPIPGPEELKQVETVFDANYVPLKNKLIKDAEKAGCNVITGDKLLLYQGVVAFKLFTGKAAPIKTMSKALMDELHRKKIT